MPYEPLHVGDVFERLTVVSGPTRKKSPNGQSFWYWICRCQCGAEREVREANLKSGISRSCGCLQREKAAKVGDRSRTHGHSSGGHVSPEYRSWSGMMTRCYNPGHDAYERYGGRGVVVCDRWHLFDNFLADMGLKPDVEMSIDRIDNNGDYAPGNCRWATPTQQNRNSRQNVLVSYEGETKCMAEWAEGKGIRQDTFARRLERGWCAEKAISTPLLVRAPRRSRTNIRPADI